MLFKRFNNTTDNLPTILLLHGGGLSDWAWDGVAERFSEFFSVITPIIDGHGEHSDKNFDSIEQCADDIIQFIDSDCGGSVYAICGVSLGGQITAEVLSRRSDIARYAIIEGAVVRSKPPHLPSADLSGAIELCYPLVKSETFAKFQAKVLNVPDSMFPQYYRDSRRISKRSLLNIYRHSSSYQLKPTLSQSQTETLLLVGEREPSDVKRSAKLLHDTLKHSHIVPLVKIGHGELSMRYPESYVAQLLMLITNKNT